MKSEYLASNYKHIDNGGVLFRVEDRGANEGVVLVIEATYYGYPSIQSSIRIDNLGSNWCKDMSEMFLIVSKKMK